MICVPFAGATSLAGKEPRRADRAVRRHRNDRPANIATANLLQPPAERLVKPAKGPAILKTGMGKALRGEGREVVLDQPIKLLMFLVIACLSLEEFEDLALLHPKRTSGLVLVARTVSQTELNEFDGG